MDLAALPSDSEVNPTICQSAAPSQRQRGPNTLKPRVKVNTASGGDTEGNLAGGDREMIVIHNIPATPK